MPVKRATGRGEDKFVTFGGAEGTMDDDDEGGGAVG